MPKFQHTATRRWLPSRQSEQTYPFRFQHTATRRWLQRQKSKKPKTGRFQHTATRRWLLVDIGRTVVNVKCFNTQPPEGGCPMLGQMYGSYHRVSTHSHPKVAAIKPDRHFIGIALFQHTATRRWLPGRSTLSSPI